MEEVQWNVVSYRSNGLSYRADAVVCKSCKSCSGTSLPLQEKFPTVCHCLGRGIAPQCPDSSQSCRCSSEQHKKQSGQLTLLFLSGHPTPPSLVVDSKVFQCSSLVGKSRDRWKGKSLSHFCFVLVFLNSEVFLFK